MYLIFINDLPKIWIGNSLQILFADDSSVAITNSNIVDFQSNIKAVFEQINKCLNFNLISFKFDKTDFIRFKKTLITEIL